MSAADRVTAVVDRAVKAHNAALAAVVTRAQTLTDAEAEALDRHLQMIPESTRAEARGAIDYAALDRSATTGEMGLINQIAEAADAGWYAAGEASGEAAKAAAAAGKWSAVGDSETDQHWVRIWAGAWQAVSDAAYAKAALGLLPGDAVDSHHYEALTRPWRAAIDSSRAE